VVTEVPLPAAGPGRVRIKLAAAGMNPLDAKLASGERRPAPARFPMVLGVDGAGIVDAVDLGVTRFSLGEKIFGQLLVAPIGSAETYAEYVAVTGEATLAPVPEGLDLVVAAAVPTVGGTGLALVDLLEPLDDKTVLIGQHRLRRRSPGTLGVGDPRCELCLTRDVRAIGEGGKGSRRRPDRPTTYHTNRPGVPSTMSSGTHHHVDGKTVIVL
jgi:Alcohol dehydrogenase GroES-like domain